MPVADDARFEDQFVSRSRTYVEQLVECVSLLPELLRAYAAGGDHRDVADRMAALESEGDRTHRSVSSLLADASVDEMGLQLTRLHLQTGQVLELYRRLDEIANGAEQFAEELVAMEPPWRDGALGPLETLAESAVEAIGVLRETVVDYVEALCDPERAIDLGDRIGRIRRLESDCDRLRTECIEAAFGGDVDRPLVYRHLAVLLDDVVDAMEDVTDQMIFVTGNLPSIDVGTTDPTA